MYRRDLLGGPENDFLATESEGWLVIRQIQLQDHELGIRAEDLPSLTADFGLQMFH